MIDGRTQLVGLLGWPVAHSLSPLMHNAAFEALGLNWRYVPLPVQPGQVAEAVRGLAALGFRGANVTVPHKQAVLPVLDRIAPEAETLGAVNTLVIWRQDEESPLIEGHNTDVAGFLGALARGGFDLAGEEPAVVVGAGGAARAVVAGLLSQGCRKVWVFNRTVEKAQALAAALDPARVEAVPFTSEALVERARVAGLLVNATTVGMVPAAEASIWPEGVPVPHHLTVFDLIYTPLETRLLQQVRAGGARALDGLEMLVQQGALAFTLWVNVDLEVNEVARLMRAACQKGRI